MANRTGIKWNKGGALARSKGISVDFSNFAEYAERLDELGASLEDVFERAMQEAAEKIQQDTIAALAKANLPAGGIYSSGDTIDSVIRETKPTWSGSVAEVKLGFDKTVYGAGGWLITGTPKMRPDKALEDIYGNKKYANEIKKIIERELQAEIKQIMGG